MTELLISYGAEMNVRNRRGRTPLVTSIQKGNWSIAELLIQKGCDTDVLDILQQSAMFYAVENNSVETVKLLIKAGANCDCGDWRGRTPLYLAITEGKLELAAILIQADFDVTAALSYLRECIKLNHLSEEALELISMLMAKRETIETLEQLCLRVIRRCLKRPLHTNIRKLHLPTAMNKYLLYDHIL